MATARWRRKKDHKPNLFLFDFAVRRCGLRPLGFQLGRIAGTADWTQ